MNEQVAEGVDAELSAQQSAPDRPDTFQIFDGSG
jgi:hypothetical protein